MSFPRFADAAHSIVEVTAGMQMHLPRFAALYLDDPAGVPAIAPYAGPSVDALKAERIAELNRVCAAKIVAGFTSSALGAPHTYPSNETDQQNLTAQVVSSMLPGLPGNWTTLQICADANGVWTYRPHNAAQIQAVGVDGKTRIQALLVHNAVRKAEVGALTEAAAVAAYDVESGWPA